MGLPRSLSWRRSAHPGSPFSAQATGYHKRDLKRFIVFLSSRKSLPGAVGDGVKDELYVAMKQDPTLLNWKQEWKKALRAWNWARSNIKGWPDIEFELPNEREEPKGLPWTAYREGLREAILAGLQRKPAIVNLGPGSNGSVRD